MPNYQNGKIYRVVAYDEDENELEYVGRTTVGLSARMTKHRSQFKCWKEGKQSFCTSFLLLKYPNAKIYLIHNYPCNSLEELEAEEGRVIQERKCVNKNIPGRTAEEKRKIKAIKKAEYLAENRDKINERQKELRDEKIDERREKERAYLAANRDKINARQRARYAALPQEQKDKDNAKRREYNASLPPLTREQKDEVNAQQRARRAAMTDEEKAEANAKKREYRAANRDKILAQERARYAAKKQAKNNIIIQRCA